MIPTRSISLRPLPEKASDYELFYVNTNICMKIADFAQYIVFCYSVETGTICFLSLVQDSSTQSSFVIPFQMHHNFGFPPRWNDIYKDIWQLKQNISKSKPVNHKLKIQTGKIPLDKEQLHFRWIHFIIFYTWWCSQGQQELSLFE